ncbi:porin [Caballeronia sp. KNU42]
MRLSKLFLIGLAFYNASTLAQSAVTLYGIVDTGVEYVSHANASGDAVVRMPGITGEAPSRWGFRGSEDLGSGLKAVFQLESGFNVRGGDIGQGGRLFGRQAWVGLQGPWGTVSFGRLYTMTVWALYDADVVGPELYGIASLDAYLANARSDNSVGYKGTFGGLTLGATYSFGRDSAGTGNSPGQGTCAGQMAGNWLECRQWSAMVKYDAPMFGIATAYDEQRGGSNAAANFFDGAAPLPIGSSGNKDTRIQLNGYVKIGDIKIGSGWLGRRVETVSPAIPDVRSNIFYIGATYQVTPACIVLGEVYRIITAQQDARGTMGTLRASYFLSKATDVYIEGAYLTNSAKARYTASSGGGGTNPAAGGGQIAGAVGIRHAF